jgi:ferredoxin
MRVEVDKDACQGHGLCAAMAPEVYVVDLSDGLNRMGTVELADPKLWDPAEQGAMACPERAITLTDDAV